MLDLNACNQQKKERNKLRVVPDYLCGQVGTHPAFIHTVPSVDTHHYCTPLCPDITGAVA